MAQLEEVKTILRSLLVSAPVKVTVSSLNRDFKSLEGRYIPHRELGYNSLQHLLYSIPDVLRVNGSSLESEVSLVITDKVAHVSDMVMKQKRPSKGRNAHAGRKSVIREYPSSYPSNHRTVNNNQTSDQMEMVSKYHNCVENNSTSSVLGNINGLSPFPRPSMSKNVNVPCFAKQKLQDIQRVEFSGSEYATKTVGSTSSKENSSASSNADIQELFPKQFSDKCDRVPSLLMHMPHNVSEEISIEKRNSGIQSKFQKLKLRTLRNKNEFNHNETKTENSTITSKKDLSKDKEIISIENDDSVKVPLEIQNKLKKLIKCHPSGIRCTDLPELYKKMFFKILDYQTYGFDRLISLCINLENIFCCEQESDCDFKLYDVENPLRKNEPKEEETICEISKSNIKVNTVDVSQIKAVKSKDWEIHVDLIPEESLKLGDVIETNSLNEYIIGDTFKIVISEIYNASKFWIYKNDGHLNGMMNSMQSFYRENKITYRIPEFLLEVGLYCVVHTLNEFQRAVIIDLLQEIGGYVKVYLIDYGTQTNLPSEKIWFLSKEFCTLPSQAVETNLAGIEPKEGIWSKQSILRFKDMVASKHIFAKILEKKDYVLSIHIAVSSMPLQTLNDLLVQEGYAVYISNCELQNTSANTSNSIEEKNPRRKLIERIRMKNQMKCI